MHRRTILVDKLLKDLIGNGDISGLPGAGQPLQMDDNAYTPAESRAANKIMRDHNVIPGWIHAGQTLDQIEARLYEQVNKRSARYVLDKLQGRSGSEREIARGWQRFIETYCKRGGRYNREALQYNLTAPQGITHKPILEAEKLVQRALSTAKGKTEKNV